MKKITAVQQAKSKLITTIPTTFDKVKLFEITISLLEFSEAVFIVEEMIQTARSKLIAIANVNTLNYAYENVEYKKILKGAALILRDGTGVKWAVQKLRHHPKYNFVGTDFIPDFCRITSKKGYKLFLLGARPGVAESAATALYDIAPGIVITGCKHGYFNKEKEEDIIKQINGSRSDILLVAFGNPKQEIWIANNLHKLNIPVCFGVGALFDYLSDNVTRAPKWVLNMGSEWIFRLLVEPKRLWKRYLLGNPKFVFRVWQEVRKKV